MFIQTEPTPNPATLKFLPGREVAGSRLTEYRSAPEAEASPLAAAAIRRRRRFAGFSGRRFRIRHEKRWGMATSQAEHPRRDHGAFHFGRPSVRRPVAPHAAEDEFFDTSDADTVDQIKELIETRVRPAVAGDGGDIRFRGYKDGTVYLAMKGACSGCPSSTATLKHGIQNLLKHFVPEVRSVEQI